MESIFFFGKNPALSLAELRTVLNECPGVRIAFEWKNAVLINGTLQAEPLVKRLGGTLKIARIVATGSQIDSPEFIQQIDRFVSKTIPEQKFFYTLTSLGNVSDDTEDDFISQLKNGFKKQKQKAIFKHAHRDQTTHTTSPKELASWNLLETKTDLMLAKTKNEFFFGYTIAVSDPREWKKRDENRPFKDNKEIISIRLAKILVNLTGLKPGETVLDPFCGYGTILQEAVLSGFNAIGIEKDFKKTQAAEQNLKWIAKQFRVSNSFAVFCKDATELSRVIKPNQVHGVVTEPYLGPYFARKPTVARAQAAIRELTPLYKTVFLELSKILAPGRRVVIVFPWFEVPNGFLRIDSSCFDHWFEPEQLQTADEQKNPNPFFYQNPNNKIGREIWVLKRK